MKKIGNILIGILVLLGFYCFFRSMEGFTSPGTMVQLATSHVPTAEDAYYMNYVYPKIVRRDLISMTGSA